MTNNIKRTMTQTADELRDLLSWSGPHGLSLGGSFKGVHAASMTGYWIHDHVAGSTRFKVYKIGVTERIGAEATLEKAKAFCTSNIIDGANSILAAIPRAIAAAEAGE